jgi:hypothetical protein
MKTLFKAGTLAAAIIALNACEVAPQDGGDNISKKFSGTVIDGRVAGGKVWVDRNDNDKWDDFEPYAFTDEDGVYSYNANTGRDYCTTTGEDGTANAATNFRNCLTVFTTADAFKIKVKGGIDTTTGEELKGLMAMDEAFSEGEVEIATDTAKKVLSPITTLLANTPEDDKATVKQALGIASDADLKVDYTSDTSKRDLFATAVAAQTVLSTIANASISAAADASSSDYETAQKAAASALVNALTSGSTSLTDMTSSDLQTVAAAAASEFASEKGTTVDTSKVETAANRVSTAVATLKAAAEDSNTTADSFAATLKVSETIVKLAEKEADGDIAASVLDNLDTAGLQSALEAAAGQADTDVDLSTVVEAIADNKSVSDAVDDAKVDTSTDTSVDQFLVFRFVDDSDAQNLSSPDAYIAVKMGYSRAGKDVEVCAVAVDEESGDDMSLSLKGDYLEVGGTYILNTLWAGTLDVDLVMKKPVVDTANDTLYTMGGKLMTPYIFKPGEALLQAAQDNDVDVSDFMENTAWAQSTVELGTDDWDEIPMDSDEACGDLAELIDAEAGEVAVAENEQKEFQADLTWTIWPGNSETLFNGIYPPDYSVEEWEMHLAALNNLGELVAASNFIDIVPIEITVD